MDLLFNEYASPFVLLDEVIPSGMFCEFLETFQKQHQERQRWNYFINKLPPWDDTSWDDFNRRLDEQEGINNIPTASKEQLETTVNKSFEILQNFNPEERGES